MIWAEIPAEKRNADGNEKKGGTVTDDSRLAAADVRMKTTGEKTTESSRALPRYPEAVFLTVKTGGECHDRVLENDTAISKGIFD